MATDFPVPNNTEAFEFKFDAPLKNRIKPDPFPGQVTEGVQNQYEMVIENNSANIDALDIVISQYCNLSPTSTLTCLFRDEEDTQSGTGSYALVGPPLTNYYTASDNG